MVDIRAEVGNNGKGASLQSLDAALKHACEKRYPTHIKECYDESLSAGPKIQELLNAGKNDAEICTVAGRCP